LNVDAYGKCLRCVLQRKTKRRRDMLGLTLKNTLRIHFICAVIGTVRLF
jgi:hypothetical protein